MKNLKKILSVLTLIILVGSDFLTSISYALEDVLEDSVVVQTENEGETENVENEEENVEEEDSEVVYEDESIEELEPENSTGNIVEEGTGEVFEIGSGEVEELTEETVEGATGDIIKELTGEVIESTGTGEETVIEDITYNEELIIGEKTYNDVTVRVEVLPGIFPEGTELKIEPIKWWKLSSLKDKLVEEKEEIEDDTTIVAFDITFKYEGEEVQPKEGEKVKVTFDYSNNEDLVKADKNDNQEVKVFHLEDKDENGEKVEKGEEIVNDVTNKQESAESGIAVANAESFSIYVLALSDNSGLTLTLNPNGGTFVDASNITFDPICDQTQQSCNGTIQVEIGGTVTPPTVTKDGYAFAGWYTDDGEMWDFDEDVVTEDITLTAQWVNQKDIVIQVTATEDYKDLKINKYFANAYTVDWGDGTAVATLSSDTIHTYDEAGTYNVVLSLAGGADRWTFAEGSKPLLPSDGTTMIGVRIISMPSLADGFGVSATNPGNYFFERFNNNGALTSLPEGSFDTSNITTVGNSFFSSFNNNGALTSLPDNSFRFSTGLTTVGYSFFSSFNNNGALTSLPEGSFDTSNITTVGDYFFSAFNYDGALTSLPDNSFRFSTGLTTVGIYFFRFFNKNGALTSLPEGSFDASNISTAGSNFFANFNENGAITNLPESFKMSLAGGYLYYNAFNSPNYTLNKKVSDLVDGIPQPSEARYTFSDNQPGRCGVDSKWLVSTANQCDDTYYTVTFNSAGGSSVYAQTVASNSKITEPDDPTRDDEAEFLGWYRDNGTFKNEFDFNTPITNDTTLYAKWQEGEDVTYTVTFDANRGTFSDVPNPIEVNDNEPIGTKPVEEPELPGYTFTGWWTEPRGGTQWDFANDIVTGNITLYAHWIYNYTFGDLDVYMIDSDGSLIKYVMMDRNMGATGVYNKDFDNQNPSSFGFVYQWGNNYGFPRCSSNGNCDYSPITNTPVSVDIVQNYIPSKFASSMWIGKNRSNGSNKSWHLNSGNILKYLWGNSNTTDMQGPCPDGYHVPSTSETNNEGGLFRVWGNIYDKTINTIPSKGLGFSFLSDDQELFTFQFLLPHAGAHKKGNTQEQEQKVCGDYWTSTPSGLENAINMWFCKDGKNTYYSNDGNGNFLFTNGSRRSNGSTLRCFKNSTGSANLDIVNGGKKGLITVEKVSGVATINAIKEPENTDVSGTDLKFGGWYTSPTFESNTMKTGGDTLSDSVTALYAKWDCPEGLAYNADNQCVSGVLVRFMDGETEYTRSVVLSGEEVRAPAINPKKAGHIFTGWFEFGANLPFVFTGTPITGNLDLYAHWEEAPQTEALITVNYYLKKLDVENNVLTGGVIEYSTGVEFIGEIGDTINISGTYLTGIVGYHYDHATIFSGAEEVTATETTVLPDGTRVINMYYIPNQNHFSIITDAYSSTEGSSTSGMYYYGAKVILSGSSSDDRYLWSGWNGLPEGTQNSAQTEFYMPNTAVTVTSSVREKTYTVTLTGTPAGYGTLSPESLSKEYGAVIVISGDKLTVGGTEVILTGNEGYEFQEWTGTCGKVEKQVCDEYIIYHHPDPIEFKGNNNIVIDSGNSEGYDLFSKTGYKKDFEISFDILNLNLGGSPKQATLLSVKNEDLENQWPGISFRRDGTTSNLELTSRGGSAGVVTKKYTGSDVHSVKISRENGKLYIAINGGNKEEVSDYSNFTNFFDKPITIGSIYQNGGYDRYIKATLSNILIKTINTCYTGNVYVVTGDCQMTAKYTNGTPSKYAVTGSVAVGQENMGYLSGSISTGASLTGLYDFGTNLIFIAIPELGYVFDYWKNGDTILSGTDLGDGTNQLTVIVDQILDIIAFFKPAENTPYTVEHYKQNLTQDGYEFAWSGTMYGTTNESTNATGTDYEGFTLSGSLVSYQTGINADGSTVVRLYYDRNTYTVMWDMWEGYPSWTVKKFDVIYGSHPVFEWDDVDQYTPKRGRDPRTDDIKYDFTFTGWVKSGSSEIIKDLTTQIVTGDVRYVAQYDTGYRYYEVRYHTDEGTGTMEPQSLQLYSSGTLNKNKFIRTGYIFSGWWYEYSDGIEVFYEDEQEINLGVEDGVLKSGGEWEDPLYLDVYAQWKPSTDTKVTVNYYLKDLDKENNVLIDSRTEYAIGVEFTGTTDSVIDSILTRYGTGINGYEYSKSIVYGTDYPSGVETGTTTILADGSRKIDMYYVPSIYQFTLNSESHSSTAGSSESTGYYYGANVKLSGDSNDDCFEWSGWTTSGITLSDNMSHQTWFAMPANDVEATPSTTENTYNIIFNGNESTSGEMSPMNGVRCAESTGLILNVFEKSGHTFTGWSTIVGGSIDYTNGGTVSRLSTGDGSNVTLYAVWDINKYNVNASVLSGNEGYLSGMGSTGISLTGLYDYATELVFIAIPELGYVFDYWKNGDTVLSGTDLGDGRNQLTVVVDQILDIIAFFKPAENTPYTVEHYKQNLDQTGYEFAWSGTMYGTTDGPTNATGTDYEGFSLSGDLASYQTGIKADGSTVVRLYYDRDTYTVTWKNWNNETMSITNEIYGSHPVFQSDGMPQRMRADEEIEYDFIFTGWIRSGTTEIIRDLIELNTEVVTGNVTYIAQYDQRYRYYEVRYNSNGGTGKMENQMFQLNTSGTLVPNTFTKTGYEFRGRSARYIDDFEGFYEDEQTININIYQDVEGDREGTDGALYLNLYAQWKPSTDTKVTVNYYLKDLDKENNVLIDSRTEYAIGVEFTGITDDIVDILARYGTGIEGYEYSTSIVYGPDYPSGIEIGTTTVLADGSRVIDMYYVPKKYNFILNTVQYSSTAGSSESTGYYYGAKVSLSGDSSDDCFTWSGWTTSGITLSDNMSHQTWFAMPANDVEATPSTTENTYNIIFNGNGSNLGIMPPMNGVRCTESTGLTLNSFERDGYTFTGWSTTAGGSRKYADGAIVDRLSTGVNVNLYAVWDVNHYTVTFDLNGGNLTGDMTETKDYTIETSSISLIDYEPERNGYTFTGWYRNDVLVNSIAGGETGDYTLVARWEAQRRPVPVVVYKKMLIPGEWSEYESELMWGWGTVGELYTAPLENFTPTGFHYEEENDSNRRTVVVDPDLRNEVAIFFARNLYPVIIDNAGEGRSSDTSGSSDYLYEEPVTISVTPYTGWEFINWTLIQGTLSGITDWTQRTLSFNMPAEQVMISPILDHIPYTVSFDTASGTTVENQTYYYDDVLSGLNSAITTRTGYNFDGWYLSGVLYTSGSTMPAENITLTAKWAPCTGVQYQVNHRGENTGDNNYEVLLSGYIMYGTSDTQTIAKSEEFAGFTLSGNVEQKIINPNGTTIVDIYYNRNVYTISLDNNGGTGVSEITGKYQSVITQPDDPNRLGYNFAGWDPSIPDTMPLNGGESTAKWNPGLTQYKVNYHIEKVQTGEYDIYTGVYAGETDSSPWIPLLNPSLTGFITPAQFTGKIIPGGTEFDYYYDRDSYMLYYDTAGGTPIPGKSFRYGEKILTGETQRPGYTLIKWNNIPEDGNMPAQSGLTLVALREPDAHTKYTVYHYFESLSGGYVTGNVQPLSGTTDTLTTARPISVPGYKTDFDIGDEEHTGGQVNIDGDGNAHVEIYYDRIVYQIAFDMNGGDAIQGTGVKFGTYIKSFIDSLNPHKKGYAFSGWNPEFPSAMPEHNLTGLAMWTPATGEYKVEFYYQLANGTYPGTATSEELRTGKTEWVGRVKDSDKESSITGYTFDSENPQNVLEGQIVGDGSLVLKVYFKKQFTVRYLTGSHGTFSEDVHPDLDYGVGTPVFRGSTGSHDSGYTFLGWNPELTGIVVEDRDYIAQWKADSDTEFKVEYYLQNVEDDGYTFAKTGLQTGTTNTTGYADTTKEFTGFIFSGGNQNNVTSGLIAGDGSLVLKLYYDRKEYNVTTGEVEHGTMEGGAGSQRYGKRITFTAHPDAGYLISKWLRDGNEILSGGVIWTGEELEVEVDTGMEISVEFEARNDTPYYVEYYKENLEGGYEVWTGTYSGTTDQEAVAQELSFMGFTYDSGDERNVTTGNIDGDGSRVLRLYYTRDINNVVYVYTGKVPSGQVVPETIGYKYEATVTVAEAPSVLGYNFSWSTGVSSFTMPDEKVVITGTWTANTGTKYAVQHMLQNIEDDGYTQTGEDQILSGETDELTNAQANNYTGFTVQSFSQTGIKGDESTIVVIKYDRNEYEVTTGEVEHGTMEGGAGSQRYGKRIIFTAHPDAGYLISKWLRDGNEILSGGVIWTGEELEIEVDTGMEIGVEFEARNDTPYYVEYYKEKLGGGYEVWIGTYSGTTDQEAVAQELSFMGFIFSGGNQNNITSGVIAGDGSLVLKLFYDRNKYIITWKDDEGNVIDTTMVEYGATPTHVKPIKAETEEYRYVFVGWTPEVVAVVGDAEYMAVFNAEEKEKSSEGGGMSGGGGRRSGIDNAENSDNQHGSAEGNSDFFTGDYYVSSGNVDEETLSLYEWAHENDITTIDTLEDANADGYLTRGHMAKIAVNFAEKILGKTVPDVYPDECNWSDKESERESQEIKIYAKKACSLGLMGIYVEEFMPNKILDRAEFGTIVSRLLWGDRYNILDTDHRSYYEDHLWALKRQGILTQTDNPEDRWEIRKWVWLVFRRISEKLNK